MTTNKRKWTYWHKVVAIDPKDHGSFKVDEIFGSSHRHSKEWPMWTKERGFFTAAIIQYLGKLPYDLHETNPDEAIRRIEAKEWD